VHILNKSNQVRTLGGFKELWFLGCYTVYLYCGWMTEFQRKILCLSSGFEWGGWGAFRLYGEVPWKLVIQTRVRVRRDEAQPEPAEIVVR